jgi:hypothetical protein
MSTPKAKSLAVFVPVGAVLVLSAMLATPGLTAMPAAYACDSGKPDCEPDKEKKKVKICHKGKTIEVSYQGWINGHKGHGDTYGKCPVKPPPCEKTCPCEKDCPKEY